MPATAHRWFRAQSRRADSRQCRSALGGVLFPCARAAVSSCSQSSSCCFRASSCLRNRPIAIWLREHVRSCFGERQVPTRPVHGPVAAIARGRGRETLSQRKQRLLAGCIDKPDYARSSNLYTAQPPLDDRRMSKRQSGKPLPPHEPDLVRCSICWGWIDRNAPLSKFEHRGPLPHPRKLNGPPEVFEDETNFPG